MTALRFGGTAVWLFSLIGVLWTARELLLLVGFFVLPLNTVLAMAPLLQAAAVLMSCWLLLDLMALSERRWVRVLKWLVACTPLVALAWWFCGEASWGVQATSHFSTRTQRRSDSAIRSSSNQHDISTAAA